MLTSDSRKIAAVAFVSTLSLFLGAWAATLGWLPFSILVVALLIPALGCVVLFRSNRLRFHAIMAVLVSYGLAYLLFWLSIRFAFANV